MARLLEEEKERLTQKQHKKTIARLCIIPIIPTIQNNRRNIIAPKICCIVGKKTPTIVPRFAWDDIFNIIHNFNNFNKFFNNLTEFVNESWNCLKYLFIIIA